MLQRRSGLQSLICRYNTTHLFGRGQEKCHIIQWQWNFLWKFESYIIIMNYIAITRSDKMITMSVFERIVLWSSRDVLLTTISDWIVIFGWTCPLTKHHTLHSACYQGTERRDGWLTSGSILVILHPSLKSPPGRSSGKQKNTMRKR